jgi:pyrrolysine biosynthesis protein PylD
MTRLTNTDIEPLEGSLDAYENHLQRASGLTLAGLALEAAWLPVDAVHRQGLADLKMAVVPVSSGLGRIGGFAQSVAATLNQIGSHSRVTRATDVAGLAEAVARGPAAIFMSDDRDFVALDPVHGTVIHNTPATAQGFVAGLARMAGGLKKKRVVLLGCGPVGYYAAEALLRRGARVLLADRVPERSAALRDALISRGHSHIGLELTEAGTRPAADLIFDATNTGDHIDVEMITEKTLVAAPGMPCGVTAAARRRLGNRLLHDPLQIGVATMAAQVYAAQVSAARERKTKAR